MPCIDLHQMAQPSSFVIPPLMREPGARRGWTPARGPGRPLGLSHPAGRAIARKIGILYTTNRAVLERREPAFAGRFVCPQTYGFTANVEKSVNALGQARRSTSAR